MRGKKPYCREQTTHKRANEHRFKFHQATSQKEWSKFRSVDILYFIRKLKDEE